LEDFGQPEGFTMSATQALLRGIKSTLRTRKLTYRDLAQSVRVSEATIKRDLSRGHFSLRRLDQICEALDLTLNDLTQPISTADVLTQLSQAQEVALASHPKHLVVTYLLVNDWTFQELIAAFDMDESELIGILLRLDKLGIIDYRPPYRIRKLTARNFSWRTDGPVHEFFVTRFAPEFFRSTFDGPGEAFRFAGGLLSAESLARFKASLERLAAEFEELARNDAKRSQANREGCSAVLAIRSWEFSEITRLRRPGSPKGGPRSR
jgi:DNA-binding Xre family transcriptional regulator